MSDTISIPYVATVIPFPGRNNFVRDWSASFAWGIENRITSDRSLVVGYRNSVNCIGSLVVGNLNTLSGSITGCIGQSNNITGSGLAVGVSISIQGGSCISAGLSNFIVGSYSAVFGRSNSNDKDYSLVFGYNGVARRYGEFVHAGFGFNTAGGSQRGALIFSNQSTSATPVILYLDGTTATQRAVLDAGARWKCTIEIVAATTGAINKSASWEYVFQVDRPTNAASTVVRTTPALRYSDGSNSGAPPAGWVVSITADTTNGCPQITVTGDSDTINWTAALHYVQTIRV